MKKQRLIGSTWTDDKGREWEVVSLFVPGIYSVRTTDLRYTGQMSARALRCIAFTECSKPNRKNS